MKGFDNDQYALWLDSFQGLSLKQKFQLLDYFVEPQNIYNNLISDAQFVTAVAGETTYKKMLLSKSEEYLSDLLNDLDKQGVKYISRFNSKYPNLLASIKKPPFVLYYKGDIDLLKTFCIGIVGTRHCTHYGADVAKKFARELAENGITVVSGLATGIDSNAHEGALLGGKTIAVFAGGIDIVYPSSNSSLAQAIAESGLIITEHKPHTPPRNYNFPLRSRIIAGLSRGILIVEATYNSGTMHTKEYAISENRDVFCVPGNITSSASSGTNMLIRNQEAICTLSTKDIFNYYYITPKVKAINTNTDTVGGLEGQILEILEVENNSFEDIKDKLSIDAKTLMQTLTKMEIKGLVKKLAGNMYEKRK